MKVDFRRQAPVMPCARHSRRGHQLVEQRHRVRPMIGAGRLDQCDRRAIRRSPAPASAVALLAHIATPRGVTAFATRARISDAAQDVAPGPNTALTPFAFKS